MLLVNVGNIRQNFIQKIQRVTIGQQQPDIGLVDDIGQDMPPKTGIDGKQDSVAQAGTKI